MRHQCRKMCTSCFKPMSHLGYGDVDFGPLCRDCYDLISALPKPSVTTAEHLDDTVDTDEDLIDGTIL